MYETSFSPASLPVFVVCFLDECQSDWGEMESQRSFDSFIAKSVEHFFMIY
jgi:hypothetical protein